MSFIVQNVWALLEKESREDDNENVRAACPHGVGITRARNILDANALTSRKDRRGRGLPSLLSLRVVKSSKGTYGLGLLVAILTGDEIDDEIGRKNASSVLEGLRMYVVVAGFVSLIAFKQISVSLRA